MSPVDILLIAAPLSAGAFLIVRFAACAARSGLPGRAVAGLSSAHHKATRTLIAKGVLGFPGAELVAPMKAWLAGEAVFLATLALSMLFESTARNALRAVIPALVFGGATIYLSLRDQARRHLGDVRTSLPLASFLLSLMLEAGMGSSAAIPEVVRALPRGPLAGELEEIARSRLLGISRDEAIERSRSRIPLDDYRLFLNLIQQGERLGVGLSQGLRELSSRMLESQGYRAEALAQKAAVKLLFPLVVFIFPAVFLVILSPVILNLFEFMGR